MPDILTLTNSFGNQRMEDIGIGVFLFSVIFAVITSFIISWLYHRFFSRRATGSQISRAFPLLSIAVTIIFITVQFSLPLSLGLLGALSIVRFRTPIKEPEEIGFVMLVVSASLSCATFNFVFPVILVLVSWVSLYLSEKLSLLGMGKLEGGLLTITGERKENSSQEIVSIERELKDVFRSVNLHSVSKTDVFTATFIFYGACDSARVTSSVNEIFTKYPELDFNLMLNNNSVF